MKEEMVKELLQKPKWYKPIGKLAIQWMLITLCDNMLDPAVTLVLAGDEFNKERESIDIGQLDGAKVQRYWGLFKTMLAERTSSGDLLPPPGFNRYRGQTQTAMQRVWR